MFPCCEEDIVLALDIQEVLAHNTYLVVQAYICGLFMEKTIFVYC